MVWILTTVVDYQTQANSYLRMGRITVDPTTLAITISWRYTFPLAGYWGEGAIRLSVWAAERLVLMSNVASPTPMNERTMYLFNLDTGAIIATRALPLAQGTNGALPSSISFHPERMEVMLHAPRVTGGFDRPAVWTAPVTTTTIGTWTLRGNVPTEVAADRDSYPDVTAALARAGGTWQIIGNYWTEGQGTWRHLRNTRFTPPSGFQQLSVLSTQASGDLYSYAPTMDAMTEGGRIIVAVFEVTNRYTWDLEPADPIGGARHITLDADSVTVLVDVVLTGTVMAMSETGSVYVVPVGDDRFIYLVAGSAITKPYGSGVRESFEFLVYAGGADQQLPQEPGLRGEAIEIRSMFRRVN
jgi:hypothetical protein